VQAAGEHRGMHRPPIGGRDVGQRDPGVVDRRNCGGQAFTARWQFGQVAQRGCGPDSGRPVRIVKREPPHPQHKIASIGGGRGTHTPCFCCDHASRPATARQAGHASATRAAALGKTAASAPMTRSASDARTSPLA
jgi:hypothetical protein